MGLSKTPTKLLRFFTSIFTRLFLVIFCMGFFKCASSQDDFEKYYNKRSNDFNKLPAAQQDSPEGLSILLEIEEKFKHIPPQQVKKFGRRMGDTYMMISGVYSSQKDLDKSVHYMEKAAIIRDGDIDVAFVKKVKMFDNVREYSAFKKILENLSNIKAASQSDPGNIKLSVKQLKKDLLVLKESFKEAHQGIYQYNSEKAIDALFEKAKAAITGEMTAVEFYKIIAPVAAAIKDGHTQVLFPARPATSKNQLPINFRQINGQLYLVKSFVPDYKKWEGKEITSINEVSATDIIQFAINNFTSDGDNITHKIYGLRNPYRFSDIITILAGRNDKFNVSFAGDPEVLLVTGINRDSLSILLAKEKNLPAIELLYPENTATSILTIRTFSARVFESQTISFNNFLQEMLFEMAKRKIKNLIIDVRGNGGGEDLYGRLLYSCFTSKEFSYYHSLTIAANKFKLFDYVEGGQRAMPEEFAVKNNSGTWDVTKNYNENIGIHQPMKQPFTGNIYVLIDGGSYSTTSEFLSHLHANTNAIFIGEESGGNYYVNNSGIIAQVSLPNSKLNVDIPMLKYVLAVPDTYPDRTHGIIPQHKIGLSIEDIIAHRDVVLEYALKLCKN